MRLQGKAGLRRAVASLGPTGRLVREQADTLESIAGDRVGGCLEGAGVVRAGHPVTPVAAAVEEAAKLHGRDVAVFRQSRLDLHEDGVTPACCSIGRCVLPSKKTTSSRTCAAAPMASSVSPNSSATALCTFDAPWIGSPSPVTACSIDITWGSSANCTSISSSASSAIHSSVAATAAIGSPT